MHVKCKDCGERIPVAGRPTGGTRLSDVRTFGNVKVEGGKISFGPGGGISFGAGGTIAFGPAPKSELRCPSCGKAAEYSAEEILDD
jgi:DNA-directed RNA polymerase subunit RPC12/RpoP